MFSPFLGVFTLMLNCCGFPGGDFGHLGAEGSPLWVEDDSVTMRYDPS